MLTQLDVLTKHVTEENQKIVNRIAAAIDVVQDIVPYEEGYNEVVHYMSNKQMGCGAAFPRPLENKRQNNIAIWVDRAWPKQPQGEGWRYHDGPRYRYLPPHNRVKDAGLV